MESNNNFTTDLNTSDLNFSQNNPSDEQDFENIESQLQKFEKNLIREMLQVITYAKDATPGLFEFTTQQETIVQYCREAASRVFVFQDVLRSVTSSTDIPRILEATLGLEQSALSILETFKDEKIRTVLKEQIQEIQESVVSLLSIISSLRIFLGRIRITNSLKAMSKMSKDPKSVSSPKPTVVQDHSNLPSFKTVEEVVEYFLTHVKPPIEQPTVVIAQHDLLKCPPWILFRWQQNIEAGLLQAQQIKELKKESETKTITFEKWKTKITSSLNQKLIELETERQALTKLPSNQSNSELVEKQLELERAQSQIEFLKKTQLETEIKLSATKDRLDNYMLETEEWKKQTTEYYHQQLAAKDNEIKELRETVELLMKKDETREEADIMNQLLDFISSENKPSPNQTLLQPKTRSPSPPSVRRPFSSAVPEPKTKLSEKLAEPADKTDKRKTSVPHLFKVILPEEEGFVTIVYEKNMTLGTVLDTICKKRGWLADEYRFRHIDARETSPFLPLSLTLGQLNVPTVKAVKVAASLSPPKYRSVPSMDFNGIGLPYNVFHTDHKTVEDLLALMEKDMDEEYEEDQPDVNPLIRPCKGFDIELGKKMKTQPNKRLIDTTKNTPYYQHYFYSKAHQNFYAETPQGPILVSLEQVGKDQRDSLDETLTLRALVRTKYDDEWVFIPMNKVKNPKGALVKAIEAQCKNGDKYTGLRLNDFTSNDVEAQLLKMEQKLLSKGYKFGILYCKQGQTEENDMFSNVNTSPEYEEFLEFMGTKIELMGWNDYRGGLDVKSNTTGTYSVYTKHRGLEIMFHVSTLLPYSSTDIQQLERKRHLGNDVCVIIFKDTDEPFSPDAIRSEFNHVFCVISPEKSDPSKTRYKINFAYKDGIGFSSPQLPKPPVFEKSASFRDFLLTKLINSERCAMYAPNFVSKLAKTKALLMQDLIKTLTTKK